MKTICVLNNKIVMSQDGSALAAMKTNAAQYPGAVAKVVSDEEYQSLIVMQPKTSDEINAPIKAQLAALDMKRIRSLAEGDTVYLAKLNEQIAALRAQLK